MWILNSISVRLCQCFTDSSLSSWSGRDESQDRLLFRSLHFQILCNSTQELCDQSLEDEMFWCDDRTNQCSVQVHSTIIHQADFYHLVTLTRSQLVLCLLLVWNECFPERMEVKLLQVKRTEVDYSICDIQKVFILLLCLAAEWRSSRRQSDVNYILPSASSLALFPVFSREQLTSREEQRRQAVRGPRDNLYSAGVITQRAVGWLMGCKSRRYRHVKCKRTKGTQAARKQTAQQQITVWTRRFKPSRDIIVELFNTLIHRVSVCLFIHRSSQNAVFNVP